MSRNNGFDAAARGRPLAHSVLEIIWRHRRISRADIARRTGLARSTVSEVVSDLLETELVVEGGDGPSRGGRRPIMLEFNDQAHVILGVDMGSTHVSAVLTDLRGNELAWEHEEHPVRTDPEGTGVLIMRLCNACLSGFEGARKRLLGVGVAVPSPVDPNRPKQVSDVLLPHWSGHGVLEHLQMSYGVPVLVDNDANIGTLAEHWWGAGRGLDDFTYVKLGTGIGSGHMISGAVYRGATGVAGEIGHMVIDPEGNPCACGNRGCLETLVGTRALVARAVALAQEAGGSALQSPDITIDSIEDAALAGDPVALQVVDEAATHLSSAMAAILNLLNPSAIVLGGSLSRLGGMLLAPIRERVRTQTLVNSAAAASILATELGPHATARGAATLVLDEALKDPRMFPCLSES